MHASDPNNATADTVDLGACGACGRRNPVDARFCGGCGGELNNELVVEHRAEAADPLIGRTIAERYRIVELLGRGGMGVVYKVEHVHIGKFMAMKLLHGALARERSTVQRFQREAEAASQLSHPNTVQVFDFGRSEGMMYLVMEYLEGEDLGQLIRREGHLDFVRAARITAQVCASVSEAHGAGIIHRDIKPENIFIQRGADGRELAKVLDFGLAKLRDNRGNITVTRAGHIVGTPYYMSPEQIRGEDVDARGDVYAIGAMLYKTITGTPPFVGNTPMAVLTKHLTEELELPSARSGEHIPEADAIIRKAMAKLPRDRFGSAEEFREALAAYLATHGEGLSDPALRTQSVVRLQRSRDGVATRKDVDAYERGLRRRGIVAYVMVLLFLGGVGYAGYLGWEKYTEVQAIPTAELEPNNVPEQANPLPPGVSIEAHLGQRTSETLSDIDLYRIANTTGERQLLEVDVSALPNMDIVLDVVRVGQTTPLLTVNAGGVGEPEHVPNFPLGPDEYFLRVHERWIVDQWPIENVSDAYRIEWRLREPEAGEEREVNDGVSRASSIGLGEERRGYIGWDNDVDVYCVEEALSNVQVALSAAGELDLVLTAIDRVRGSRRDINAGGAGQGESMGLEAAEAGSQCFEVRVAEGKRSADPDNAYTLSIVDEATEAGDAP